MTVIEVNPVPPLAVVAFKEMEQGDHLGTGSVAIVFKVKAIHPIRRTWEDMAMKEAIGEDSSQILEEILTLKKVKQQYIWNIEETFSCRTPE